MTADLLSAYKATIDFWVEDLGPALAYRFDFKDRSIVFSGDTAPVAAVTQLAKGADILVHEALYMPALEGLAQPELASMCPSDARDCNVKVVAVPRAKGHPLPLSYPALVNVRSICNSGVRSGSR